MRILLVTEDVPARMLGGAGQHAVVLGNALIDAGHEVHLLGYRREDGFDGDNGFKGTLHTGIDFRGARWHEHRTGAFLPVARPHMARRLWKAIRRLPGPWDVVHYHGHNPLLGSLVPPSWNFLHTLHDQGSECITRMRFRQGEVCRETRPEACADCANSGLPKPVQRWLSAHAVVGLRNGAVRAFTRHQAIFVSDFVRRRFLEATGLDPAGLHTRVVHNFVDGARLMAGELIDAGTRSTADARLHVFGAGRIDEAKGFARFLDELDDAMLGLLRVEIAGDGPGLASLRARHEGRGVSFLGWRTPAEVLAATRAADVCVVPSLCEEACSTAILEALSLGRTVFCLARGGNVELAQYGAPGQLRLFADMPALVAALRDLTPLHAPAHRRATVAERLPELMALYRRSGAEPLPTARPA